MLKRHIHPCNHEAIGQLLQLHFQKSMALILKQMIASRRSGPVVVFKMHELQSPDQMTHVIIPLLNIDLRTVHGLVNAAVNTKVIASLPLIGGRHPLRCNSSFWMAVYLPNPKVMLHFEAFQEHMWEDL
jgi:hypothetical protein